jgi:prevent-host-death family protein
VQYTLEQLRDQFEVLIARAEAGEELVITRDGRPIVRISPVPAEKPKHQRPPPGSMKRSITYMAPDFDAPLEDFKEYME